MNTRLLVAAAALGAVAGGYTSNGYGQPIVRINGDDIVLARGWLLHPELDTAAHSIDNPFLGSRENPLSAFSLDVGTASYASISRFLRAGGAPPPDAVRIEEMVNHFPYGYPPGDDDAISLSFEVNDCPWNEEARLVRLGLRSKPLEEAELQVELDPARVVAYRLIGHENPSPRLEDFDGHHAGELGAGGTVTVLYEVIPSSARTAGDLLTVKARYKLPDGWFSRKREWAVRDGGLHLTQASADFRFAAAVAAFGMILRASPHRGTADHDLVFRLASDALGADRLGDRRGFLELVRLSRDLGPVSNR